MLGQKSFSIKWLSIALLIKSLLFIFFSYSFIQNWPLDQIVNHIFIISGDTEGYYTPVEDFVEGYGYTTYCRMPGLLPVYAPLHFLFGSILGKTLVIILQFLCDVVSVYVLAKTALLLFKKDIFFYVTFFLYALSSFNSIYVHYGLSDSFAVSFLIFSVYFIVRFTHHDGKVKHLFLCGIFIGWSIFFRPIHGLIIPILGLIIIMQTPTAIKKWVLNGTLFIIPITIFISSWAGYNYYKHKKLILFQGDFEECYGSSLPQYHIAIRNLLIAWGGDFQHWSKEKQTQWFFNDKSDYKNENPFSINVFSSAYTIDSLIEIKQKYNSIRSDTLAQNVKKEYQSSIVNACTRYISAYKNEHAVRYYLFNRLTLIRKFIFPTNLDNIPFPKFSEMKWYQKVIKGGYLILLNFIMLMGSIGIVLTFSRKNIYGLIPLTFIVTLAAIMGFIEQRYLTPAYPFMCVLSSFTLICLFNKLKSKKKQL